MLENWPGMFSCSCFLRWRSRLVCWPKQRLHRWHLKGFSLLWMLRTWRWRLDEMLKERSQYLHLGEEQHICTVSGGRIGSTFPSNFTVKAAKMSIEVEIIPVGLLACVCSQVSGEVRRSREDFPAVPGGTEWTEKEAWNSSVNVKDAQVLNWDPRVYLHA